jgi:hypothetical protein
MTSHGFRSIIPQLKQGSKAEPRRKPVKLLFRLKKSAAVDGADKKRRTRKNVSFFYGAGDEARTRYLHLGKVALYQMSYTCKRQGIL